MRALWLTDIHLNFLQPPTLIDQFLERLSAERADAVLISGDIGEAPTLTDFLRRFDERIDCPVYFVLGNHDFYYSSIDEVRRKIGIMCHHPPQLTYLTHSEVIELTPTVGLIGHDGWADGRLGDYATSEIMLSDYMLINELTHITHRQRLSQLKALGDEAAKHFKLVLPQALNDYAEVILLTHVPPFRDACWHEGEISNDQWLPHFSCKAVGDVLLKVLPKYPDRKVTVLCGHTHSCGETQPLPNLTVLTGEAEYGRPEITREFQFT